MKDWLKIKKENNFKDLLTCYNELKLEKVPEDLCKRTIDIINNSQKKIIIEEKKYNFQNLMLFKRIIPITAVIIIAFLVTTSIFIFNRYYFLHREKVASTINFISGDIKKLSQGDIYVLKPGDIIKEGDIISTRKNSKCKIQFNNSVIMINESSRVSFEKIANRSKKIRLYLEYGQIFVNVEKQVKNSIFEVNTQFAIATVIGTKFMVATYRDQYSKILVFEGIVNVKNKVLNEDSKDKTINISQGESITIKDNTFSKEQIYVKDNKIFDNFNDLYLKNLNNLARIYIKTDDGIAKLKISNKEVYIFENIIGLYINPGDHTIMLEKDGYQKNIYNISLNKEEYLEKEIIFRKLSVSDEWKLKKIYNYNYKYDTSKNKILGFAISKKHIVAQTEVSLLCFNSKGRLIWKNEYGKEKGMFFKSIPVIHKQKVYVSSVNKIFLILDLKTGEEIKISSIGDIIFGYKIVPYKNKIFIPFGDGIYIMKDIDHDLGNKPLIFFNSPTTPLIIDDKIYISSFVDKIIACFDLEGNKLWDYHTSARSINNLIFVKENIFGIDIFGNLYKLSFDGKLLQKAIISNGITSNLSKHNNNIFTIANDGYLYSINIDTLEKIKIFKVDEPTDNYDYIYKQPFIFNDKLFIGTDNGKVIIYDLASKKIEEIIKLSGSKISSSVYYTKNNYCTGTNAGEIFLIK